MLHEHSLHQQKAGLSRSAELSAYRSEWLFPALVVEMYMVQH